ncbi:DSBA oxidoreductase [Tatumella morbirosei]|uniref:DSBA oxidoreductase n=1 Tax=Tatumella morbirosei TaxID=642227 RepID=A0A095T7C0_9GAMM|nr:MFS transporter [Tatumella morbirosei]KGD72786.1 DSBA oxidoreductase [Tatumella morbirosei]
MQQFQRPALVIAVCLGTFMASLDISIVNVALDTMQSSLNTTMAGLQWVVDAYALCLSGLILSSGPLGDRYGRKRIWLVGIALFTVGSAVCALSGSLPVLLAGRVIQGIAGAAVIPGALTLLSHAFPDQNARLRVIGLWSSISAVSLALGPLLGGWLVNSAGWPSIFVINLPVGIVALLLGAYGLQENAHPEHAALDPLGQVLSILTLGCLTYGLISAGQSGWLSITAYGSVMLSVLAFVALLWTEQRVVRPLLPLSLFSNIDFSGYTLASAVLGFSSYSSIFLVSLFLQQAQGQTPFDTGWKMAPEFIAMAVTSLLFGRISARFRSESLAVSGFIITGTGLLLLSRLQADSHYSSMALWLMILGAGMGVAIPAVSGLVMRSTDAQRAGMASATMNAVRQAGMTLGIALLGSVMSLHARHQLTGQHIHQQPLNVIPVNRQVITAPDGLLTLTRHAYASGFSLAVLCAGLVSLLMAAGLALLCSRRFRSANPPEVSAG